MDSNQDCQHYYEQKYAGICPVHPLIIATEFLPRPPCGSPLNDWKRLTNLAEQHRWILSADWQPSVLKAATALVVTDCQERIAWVNRGFTRMTGYSMAQVTGRNPNFLQGETTDMAKKKQIRQHVHQRLTYSGTLLNYRHNGQPYWCRVRIHPLYNQLGELVHFIAIENEVKNNS